MTRSNRSARQAGTKWETAIVGSLIAHGWPHAERRRLAGAHDRGDIAGIPGVVVEAKNTNRLELAAAMDEATVEAVNANAAIGVAWIKRKGRAAPEDGYVVMRGETFMQLLREAGYQ